MSLDIVDNVMEELDSAAEAALAARAGVEVSRLRENTRPALSAMLAGISRSVLTPGGAALLNERVFAADDTLIERYSARLASHGDDIAANGRRQLDGLFGAGGAEALRNGVSDATGASLESTGETLSTLAPLMLCIMKKRAVSEGLDADGLGALLAQQADMARSDGSSDDLDRALARHGFLSRVAEPTRATSEPQSEIMPSGATASSDKSGTHGRSTPDKIFSADTRSAEVANAGSTPYSGNSSGNNFDNPGSKSSMWKKILPIVGVLLLGWIVLNLFSGKGEPDSAADATTDAVADTASDAADAVEEGAENVADGAASAVDSATETAADAADATAEAVDGAVDATAEAVDGAVEATAEAVDGAVDATANVVEGAVDATSDAADATVQAVAGATDAAVDATGDAVDGAADMASDAADATTDAVEGAVDDAADAVDGATDEAADAAEGAADEATDAAEGAADAAEGAADDAADATEGAVDEATDAAEGATDEATDAAEGAADAVEGAADDAADAAESAVDEAADAADGAENASAQALVATDEAAGEAVEGDAAEGEAAEGDMAADASDEATDEAMPEDGAADEADAGSEEGSDAGTEATETEADTDVADAAEAATPFNLAGVSRKLGGVFGTTSAVLGGVTNAESAEKALPRLTSASDSLTELAGMVGDAPESAQGPLSRVIDNGLARVQPLVDTVMTRDGVGEVLAPVLEPMMETLSGLSPR